MHTLKVVVVLVGGIGSGLLALGAVGAAVSNPVPSSVSSPPTQEWSFEIDEGTLSTYVNAWAVAQPPVQTPLGAASLQDLSASLRDNQVGLRGTVQAGWLRAPFDVLAVDSIDHGRVLVHVIEAHLNGVDLPDTVRQQVDRQLQKQLDESIGPSTCV